MKNKTAHFFVFLIFLTFYKVGFSQSIKATLTPTTEGYQTVKIPQEFRALIGTEITKVRIKDAEGNEIPYVIKAEPVEKISFNRITYTTSKNDSSEIITIYNQKKESLQNLTLKIANTKVSKHFAIEGSDDQTNWFSIMNNAVLDQLENEDDLSVLKNIDFPLNRYKYLRIRINNKNSIPIQILDIGTIQRNKPKQAFEKLQNVSYTVSNDKKSKLTTIEVQKNGIIPFDLISFHISAPKDYFRQAYLYNKETIKEKTKSGIVNLEVNDNQVHFTLTSTQANRLYYPFTIPTNTFYIVVENDINTPLSIDSLVLYQEPIYIIANLNQNTSYSIEADNTWPEAVYDINKLQLNFADTLQSANVSEIQKHKAATIDKQIADKNLEKQKNKNNWLLIAGLCVAVIAIFYFGRSLIQDMQNKQ